MPPGGLGLSMQGGTLQNVSPNASREEQMAVLNDVINRLNGMLKTTVQSDGTNKRYLQGYQANGWPGGDFGMKISIPGVDVTQATNTQLLFSWDYTTNTQIFYDPITHLDIGQQGILPNGEGGSAWSKKNDSVSGAFAG